MSERKKYKKEYREKNKNTQITLITLRCAHHFTIGVLYEIGGYLGYFGYLINIK